MTQSLVNKLLVLLLLAMVPAAAQAAVVLYAVGNGEVLASILRATAMFMSESSYATLVSTIAVVSFIFVGTSATFGGVKPEQVIGYFVLIILVVTVMFRATMTIDVVDVVEEGPTTPAPPNIVTDVPLAVGFPAAFISGVGDFLLRGVETFFSYPDGGTTAGSPISLRRSGQFNLVAQMVNDAGQVRITDSNIRSSMYAYIQNCVVPWMHKGYIDPNEVMESNNLWGAVYNNALSMTTVHYSQHYEDGKLIACGSDNGYDGTNPYKTTADESSSAVDYPTSGSWDDDVGAHERIASQLSYYAPELVGQGFDAFQQTNAASFFKGAYSSAWTALTDDTSSLNTAELMLNNAVINTYSETASDVISTMGGGDGAAFNVNRAQAIQGQKSGWMIAASVFQQIMGYLYTVLQAFVLAMMPLIAIGFLVPKFGVQLATSLVKMMVWLAIWIPALGIVNFIVLGYLKQSIGPELSAGVTMSNIHVITDKARNAMLAGSFFATTVPLITWGLVSSGGFALTEFLSGGIGGQQAKQAGQKTAEDSFSIGQRSMDSTSGRSTNLARTFDTGFHNPSVTRGMGADIHREGGSRYVSVAGKPQLRQSETSQETKQQQAVRQMKKWSSDYASSSSAERGASAQRLANRMGSSMAAVVSDAKQASQLQRKFSEGAESTISASQGTRGSKTGESAQAASSHTAVEGSGSAGIQGKAGAGGGAAPGAGVTAKGDVRGTAGIRSQRTEKTSTEGGTSVESRKGMSRGVSESAEAGSSRSAGTGASVSAQQIFQAGWNNVPEHLKTAETRQVAQNWQRSFEASETTTASSEAGTSLATDEGVSVSEWSGHNEATRQQMQAQGSEVDSQGRALENEVRTGEQQVASDEAAMSGQTHAQANQGEAVVQRVLDENEAVATKVGDLNSRIEDKHQETQSAARKARMVEDIRGLLDNQSKREISASEAHNTLTEYTAGRADSAVTWVMNTLGFDNYDGAMQENVEQASVGRDRISKLADGAQESLESQIIATKSQTQDLQAQKTRVINQGAKDMGLTPPPQGTGAGQVHLDDFQDTSPPAPAGQHSTPRPGGRTKRFAQKED